LSFRVSRISDVRVTAIKIRFGEGLKSVWARLTEHPEAWEFVQNLNTKSFYFETKNESSLKVHPQDVTDLEISAYINLEFLHKGQWVSPPELNRPLYRRLVLPVKDINSFEKLIQLIKTRFSSGL